VDPDPAFHLNADPDQGAKAIWIVDPSGSRSEIAVIKKSDFDIKNLLYVPVADPDPAFYLNADPDQGAKPMWFHPDPNLGQTLPS
jgi:hypothetical protein